MTASLTDTTSLSSMGSIDKVRYPCATVVPNGPFAAASESTWIHWWSPVASAKRLICSCVISCQSLVPSSRSPDCSSSSIVRVVVISFSSLPHRLTASLVHRGEHSGRRGTVREAVAELLQQRVRVPTLIACEQFPGFPAAEHVDYATVDEEHLTGDVLGLVCAERDDDRRVVRRVRSVEAVLRRWDLTERGLGHACSCIRRDRVHGHSVPLELLCGNQREADDPGFRGAVVQLADVAEDAGRARRVDHARGELVARLRALAPMGRSVPRGREVAFQVHLDHRVPFVLFHVDEHAVTQDPGIVDEDVQAAECCDGAVDQALRAGEIGDVLSVRNGRAAEGLDLPHDVVRGAGVGALAGQRRAQVVHDDLCAGTCQRKSVLPADPAAGAGDDCDLSVELGHYCLLVSLPVMLPSLWVASTKPEAALDRSKAGLPC